LNPNFDFDKPNKLVPVFHKPSKIETAHTPEKIKNPGSWKFYDFDLNAIKEEIGKDITFARNLSK
jgi:hypothetical protein